MGLAQTRRPCELELDGDIARLRSNFIAGIKSLPVKVVA